MMEGWKEIKLKELVSEMGDGGTPSTLNEGNFGGDIPWVVVDDVKPEIYSTKDSLTEQGYKSCSAKMWDVGTIILTTGATIGKVGIAKVPLCTKQGITGIVCNEYANNLFIRYWLEANEEQLIRYAQGTTFKEIRTRPLGNLKIMIPNPFTKESVAEQTAIAAILSKVDEAIAAVQGSIAAAERLKKSLMQNLLTGRMKPDGTLRKDDEFYMDEKFGKVPKGWEVKRLKDICLNSGDYGANASAIDYDETKPRFIRITDIDDFGQLLDDGKAGMAGDNYSKYLLEEDDFLFARTGDTVGKSLLYKKEMGLAVYAGYLIKFSFDKSKVMPEYFDLIAKSEFFDAFKIAMKRVGAKPNINSREYCSFKFLLPSDTKEQKEIYGKFANINKSQKSKQQKIAVLERLKKSLMQNLLTGRVRVIRKLNN